MYDLPGAVQIYPNGAEAQFGALTQASDQRHISVVADLPLNIGRRNPDRAPALDFSDLLCFCLRPVATRNHGESSVG